MTGKIRWKKQARETGLRSIGAPPQGYVLHDGKTEYATISPNGGGWIRKQQGWYWVVPTHEHIPYKNTWQSPCESVEDAKAQAKKYVMGYLEKATGEQQ